jgi:hypothetical protein
MARMMRKSNRARSTSDAALLLLWGICLLVCHELDGGGLLTLASAFVLRADLCPA